VGSRGASGAQRAPDRGRERGSRSRPNRTYAYRLGGADDDPSPGGPTSARRDPIALEADHVVGGRGSTAEEIGRRRSAPAVCGEASGRRRAPGLQSDPNLGERLLEGVEQLRASVGRYSERSHDERPTAVAVGIDPPCPDAAGADREAIVREEHVDEPDP
jgi:hypothetical protein